ncbi:caspase-3-like isoform X1 [Boleophthalmus pectinirostris]|uniref:caspase-3-like isoform X1 n=1 Tax=Boleophthalmus pectinirostris TaxID=150288 RepID=UPI002432020D|nr:caspase-3-like isoform X1 [Boleophthalmus pectinirostris]
MADKQDTVDAAIFVANKGQSNRNTVSGDLSLCGVKKKNEDQGWGPPGKKKCEDRSPVPGCSTGPCPGPPLNTADSNSFTIVIKVKANKEKSSGFTVDSAEIMDNEKQIRQNTEDSAKITKAHEKLSCGDVTDAGKLQMETTSSSVRAVPTVQDSEDQCMYQMNFPCVGVCLIINNKYFKVMDTRNGTDEDEAAAKETFGALGYKVIVHKDLTKKEMKQELEKVSKEDHSGNASFVCVILSHGKEEGICGTDDIVTLEKLTRYFKGDQCRTLIGKPKLFFLQVCRGENLDSGTTDRDMVDATALPITQKIPVEADFLYAYATAPGYYAWRNFEKGSWFIQSLCEILLKYKHLELMQILTRVNRKVAFEFVSSNSNPKYDGKKAVPSFTSMLTKDFYFPE